MWCALEGVILKVCSVATMLFSGETAAMVARERGAVMSGSERSISTTWLFDDVKKA